MNIFYQTTNIACKILFVCIKISLNFAPLQSEDWKGARVVEEARLESV